MNHTLKSLLITSLLTLPSLMGADALSNPAPTLNREMREITRNAEAFGTEPATRSVYATLVHIFRELDNANSLNQSYIDEVQNQLIPPQLGEAAKQRALARYHTIHKIVDHYLNEIIDRKPYVMADLVTFQNSVLLGTFVIVHGLLLRYGPFYYAVAPFAGGLTLYLFNQLLHGFSLAFKDGLIRDFEVPKSKIHRIWAMKFSKSTSSLTELLTYTLMNQNLDISTGQLGKKLDDAFLNFNTFVKVLEELSLKK